MFIYFLIASIWAPLTFNNDNDNNNSLTTFELSCRSCFSGLGSAARRQNRKTRRPPASSVLCPQSPPASLPRRTRWLRTGRRPLSLHLRLHLRLPTAAAATTPRPRCQRARQSRPLTYRRPPITLVKALRCVLRCPLSSVVSFSRSMLISVVRLSAEPKPLPDERPAAARRRLWCLTLQKKSVTQNHILNLNVWQRFIFF